MRRWSNFDAGQISWILQLVPTPGEPGEAQDCPNCGSSTLRWYTCRNPVRTHLLFTYVWCGTCRQYCGETTGGGVGWDLPDPLGHLGADDRMAMSSDLEAFFVRLDGLWQSGELPQVRPARGVRLRPIRGGKK